MYNNATVIRLAPSTPVASSRGGSSVSSVRNATFEEAFGEYSELRGGRRKKRQERKLEKIEAKRERKSARTEARKAKKLGRIEARDEVRATRQGRRIARKTERKLGRQERRTAVMEQRQGRKTGRMDARQGRKTSRVDLRQGRKMARRVGRLGRRELGREDELDVRPIEGETVSPQPTPDYSPKNLPQGRDSGGQGGYADEQVGGYADEQQSGGYADQQGGGYADQQGGGYADQQGGGYADDQQGTGYTDQQGGGYSDEEEGDYYDEQGGEYSEEGDDSGYYSDEEEMGDYDTEEDAYDYSEPFDGIPVDASFSEMDDSGKASKKVTVNPNLQDLVNKIEWNKELVARLESKRRKGVANPSDVSRSIIERKKRIAELQGQLEMYLGFDSYSEASGMSERQIKNEVARRRMEVNSARKRAMAIRKGSKNERALANVTNQRLKAKMRRNHGGDVTPVDVDLKPEIMPNRIVVPAEPTSRATGIIGLDDMNDYDARELDIQLGADGTEDFPMRQPFSMAEGDYYYGSNGETSKSARAVNWKGVALGIGVGALAIWAIRKYKFLK